MKARAVHPAPSRRAVTVIPPVRLVSAGLWVLLVASVLLLYMPTRAAGLPTKVFALDESRISASNLHVINFDMTALADYYTDKLIDASKLNAVNEELRLDGFKREYPDAVHAFAHIRPCLVNCGNAYGGVAWLVNSFYPENGLLVRILQEHVPGFCVDDGRESRNQSSAV